MIYLLIIFIIFILVVIYSSYMHYHIECKIDHDYTLPTVEEVTKTHKIIWSYWNTSLTPLIVKLARHTWYKNNPNYLICILSDDTVGNYVDINSFPKKYNQCSVQHRADIIRIALLEKYGGFWLDATILLNQSLDKLWDFNYDIGGYEADFFTTNPNKPVLENWFLSAPKNSKLVTAWKNEFYQCIDSDQHLYIKNMEKTVDLQNITMRNYLMMHCCFLKVINDTNYKWKMLPASKELGPLSYLPICNWNIATAAHYLLTSDEPIPPVLKLRMPERVFSNFFIYYASRKSIIGRLLY
jgi:hypothetical protein